MANPPGQSFFERENREVGRVSVLLLDFEHDLERS